MRDLKTTLCYRWFQEVWNQNQEQTIHELLSNDCHVHGIPSDAEMIGIEGFKFFYNNFKGQFNNIQIQILDVIAQDDMECAHTAVTATHTETGKEVKFSGFCLIRIENGKIAEAWNQYDFLNMYHQLGQVLTTPENVH